MTIHSLIEQTLVNKSVSVRDPYGDQHTGKVIYLLAVKPREVSNFGQFELLLEKDDSKRIKIRISELTEITLLY